MSIKIEYVKFKIPKKRKGEYREILAPVPELKAKQEEILSRLYDTIPVSPFAHGGVPFRSILTNAIGHVKKRYVGSVDIKNCFPSVKKEIFINKTKEYFLKFDAEDLFEEVLEYCFYEGALPQGAPTSPYLLNIFLVDFDWKVAWGLARRGITYSRYFDDITISTSSTSKKASPEIYKILTVWIPSWLGEYRLAINPKKTNIAGRGRRQYVCGVVVNDKLNVPRRYRKNIRAALHNGCKDRTTLGKANFISMVRETEVKAKDSITFIKEWLEQSILLAEVEMDETQKETLSRIKESIEKSQAINQHGRLPVGL